MDKIKDNFLNNLSQDDDIGSTKALKKKLIYLILIFQTVVILIFQIKQMIPMMKSKTGEEKVTMAI